MLTNFRGICALLLLCALPSLLCAQAKPAKNKEDVKQTEAGPAGFADLDAYVERLMKEWSVPGAAVSIVKDGKVIWSKGYGLREMKNNLPVTEQTLFPIASITKSFTATALASLVSDHKLSWDKPVRDYLPDFRLYDEILTANVTARDLLSHRTGIPSHNLVWFHSGLSPEELYMRVRYLQPNHGLRTEYQYNNIMYMVAGYLAGKVNGTGTWTDAVQERIFNPLGMKSSNFDMEAAFKSSPDVAHPYRMGENEVPFEVPPYTENKTLGAAGAIVSNLSDMTQYLLMYVNEGKYGDRQVIPVREIRNNILFPEMPIEGPNSPEFGDQLYGLGFNLTTYRGHKYVEHTGGLQGFSLSLSFLPTEKSGCVILSNMEDSASSKFTEVLSRSIDDRLLGLPPIDWDKRLHDRYVGEKERNKKDGEKKAASRNENARFAHPVEEYYGEYTNPAYGSFLVEKADGPNDLKITFHTMHATAEHWEYEVWNTGQSSPDPVMRERKIMFTADWDGKVNTLRCTFEPSFDGIVFTRVPAKPATGH